MDLKILEDKLEYYNKYHKIDELNLIEKNINDDYESLKTCLYDFHEVYHFIFVHQNELDQDDLGDEMLQALKKISAKCNVNRNKRIFKEVFNCLKFDSIYKPYNYYFKKLVKLTTKGKLDYLLELYHSEVFIFKNRGYKLDFSLDRESSELLFVDIRDNPERKKWYLNFNSKKLFEEFKIQFETFTNAEINNQIINIERFIEKSKSIKPSIENNYFDFNDGNMHDAYHVSQNLDFYGKLNAQVYGKNSKIVLAYTQANRVLPYLKELLYNREVKRDELISQELYQIYKELLLNQKNPKGWFIAGVILATGKIKEELKKFNENFSLLSKELFGTEMSKKIRPYLSTSYYDRSTKSKNIFMYPEKVAKIKYYCSKNNIEIDPTFSKNAKDREQDIR